MHPFFFIRTNGKFVCVDLKNILQVTAQDDIVKIFTKEGTHEVKTDIHKIRELLKSYSGRN